MNKIMTFWQVCEQPPSLYVSSAPVEFKAVKFAPLRTSRTPFHVQVFNVRLMPQFLMPASFLTQSAVASAVQPGQLVCSQVCTSFGQGCYHTIAAGLNLHMLHFFLAQICPGNVVRQTAM